MHVVIIGNGVTGATAARDLRRLDPDCRITMVSGESRYHYARPALMYIFMGHMSYQDTKPFEDHTWAEQRIDLVRDWVTGIDTDARRIDLHGGGALDYDRLLLALGSTSNRFGWPGQDLDGVQGLWGLPDLKRLYDTVPRVQRAVIVGGGLIGIELAEMLHSRGLPVTFLVRESSYWNNILPVEESAMVNRLIRQAGFDLRLDTELEAIEGDEAGRVRAVVLKGGERLDCELVGLTAGVRPNIELVADTAIETGRGILVDDSLHTNVDGVLAAGDCAEIVTPGQGRNLIQQVWYTGKAQARVAAQVLAGREVSYDPGIWYNSAKFLDLEYHTYGDVNRRIDGERSLYWEHASGLHAIRLVYLPDRLIGVNTMGARFRHHVCESWIADALPVAQVVERLPEAAFDAEFTHPHAAAAADHFRRELAR
jgi:NADPH-dependent 2,4-dienoyl-CoA reductase/sulfur reductase-like enzyme